jgi:large subunit ribosomal protein L4e
MFAPTRIWRRWHRKINVNQRRYATVSAIAASAVPALVMARGHKIDNVPEIPLVVSNDIESIKKTKQAVAFLKKIGAYDDVQRVKDSKTLRCGVGKSRNRRFTQRVGPLVVFNGDEGIQRAFRNIPGVDLCHVSRLNLLQLAPGSHLGRFIIWSASAFEELNTIYGTEERNSSIKSGYVLPRHSMTSSDLARVINSDAVQSVIRPAIFETSGVQLKKKNALKNREVMLELNPYFAETRKREAERIAAGRKKVAKTNRDAASKAEGKKYWEMMMGEGPSSSEEEESEEEEESDE